MTEEVKDVVLQSHNADATGIKIVEDLLCRAESCRDARAGRAGFSLG